MGTDEGTNGHGDAGRWTLDPTNGGNGGTGTSSHPERSEGSGAGAVTSSHPERSEGSGAGAVSEVAAPLRVQRPASSVEVRSVAALVDACQAMLTARVEEPRGDAIDIVTSLFDVPRSWATTQASSPVDDVEWKRATDAARWRATGMPLQYAVGRAAFRHLTLDVDSRVLIPRPETELLVELALEAAGRDARGGLAVDVGTGSGAIALALASEGHFDRVIATDLSRDALAVAARNVTLHREVLRAVVELRHGSLLAPVRATGTRARLVVSNPPYIAYGEAAALPPSVRDWEPAVALFSGDEGMRDTACLVREAAEVLEAGGVLALEVDARRASLAAECVAATARFGDVRVVLDLAGRERFVVAHRLRD